MKTVVEQVIGPYEGKRIARTSGEMLHVVLSRTYNLGEHRILVRNIHAQQDAQTGRIFVPGPLALRINREVERVLAILAVPEDGQQMSDDAVIHIDAATLAAA